MTRPRPYNLALILNTVWPVLSGPRPTSRMMPSAPHQSVDEGEGDLGFGTLVTASRAGFPYLDWRRRSTIPVDMGQGKHLAVIVRAVTVGITMNPGHRKVKINDTMPRVVVCWPCGNMGHARPMCA